MTPDISDLSKETAEGTVIHVGGQYEWVFGIHNGLVDGRRVFAHKEDGEVTEMVSEMSNYYLTSFPRFVESMQERGGEIIGDAEDLEEVQDLTRADYEDRYQ